MKQRLTAVMYGWLSILILLLITSMTLALFLRFTSLTNPLLNQLAVITSFLVMFISGLISGLISGIKAKLKGLDYWHDVELKLQFSHLSVSFFRLR